MSGVGEAASVAGLIAIAGQCVGQIIKLVAFIKEYRDVSSNAQAVAEELEALHTCLIQVEDLARRAEGVLPDASDAVQALNASLTACRDMVVEVSGEVPRVNSKAKSRVWKKINVAGRRDLFTKLHARITVAKQDLALNLDIVAGQFQLLAVSQLNDLAVSASSIGNDVILLVKNVDYYAGATHRSLEMLDEKLQKMQRLMEHSIEDRSSRLLTERPKQSTGKQHRISPQAKMLERVGRLKWNSSRSLQQHYVRIVAEAWLVYSKNGREYRKPTTREISCIEEVDTSRRRSMILYVQNLRTLLWLLRRDNFLPSISATRRTSDTSHELAMQAGIENSEITRPILARQAGIASLWEFRNAFHELVSTFPRYSETRRRKLAWLNSKPWLRYVFSRVRADDDEVFGVISQVKPQRPRLSMADEHHGIDKISSSLTRICEYYIKRRIEEMESLADTVRRCGIRKVAVHRLPNHVFVVTEASDDKTRDSIQEHISKVTGTSDVKTRDSILDHLSNIRIAGSKYHNT